MSVKLAVVYYSATGSVHALATALTEGAEKAGAEVRLRRAPELAGEGAIDSNPAWRAFVDATKHDVAEATLEDLSCPGYTDPLLFAAGGNPYGTSSTSNDGPPSAAVLEAARYQGRLVVDVAERLAG